MAVFLLVDMCFFVGSDSFLSALSLLFFVDHCVRLLVCVADSNSFWFFLAVGFFVLFLVVPIGFPRFVLSVLLFLFGFSIPDLLSESWRM